MVISPKGREFARLLYKDTRCMDDVGMFSCRYYATVVWEGAGFEGPSIKSGTWNIPEHAGTSRNMQK